MATLLYLSQNYSYYIRGDRSPLSVKHHVNCYLGVDVEPVVQEDLHHVAMPVPGGQVERWGYVCDVTQQGGGLPEQELQGFQASVLSSQIQSRLTTVVSHSGVRTILQRNVTRAVANVAALCWTMCWLRVGPAFVTLAQHEANTWSRYTGLFSQLDKLTGLFSSVLLGQGIDRSYLAERENKL